MSEETVAHPAVRWAALTPEKWREDLLRIVLRVLVIAGGLVYLPSLILSVRYSLFGVAILDTVALAAILSLAFFDRAPQALRALLTVLVMYALGAGLMVSVGSISQIYLFAFSLLATLLLHVRAGLASVALNAITMLAIGYAGVASPEMVVPRWNTSLAGWTVISANFVFINLVLVLALGAVVRALESALARSVSAQQSLGRERLQLLELNQSLAHEVREHVRAEAALSESKALLRIAGRTARIGGWRVDLGEERVRWSDEVCLLHEVPAGASPTLAEALAFYPAEWREPMSKAVEGCAREGIAFDLEAEIVTAGGTRLWVRAIGNPRRDDGGAITGVQGSVQDITQQKAGEVRHAKLELQLRQAQKMEAVGRLAGGVAHDFNNLLSVILLNAAMTRGSLEEGDPRRLELDEIIDAGNRSADLTRQLLAFARQQPIAPRVLDLNDVIAHMLKMLGRLIGEDIQLGWQGGPGPCLVKMDGTQIDQILANLVVNARDAIAGVGRVLIETRTISFDEKHVEQNAGYVAGDFVQLSVSDTGCGMDKETQARLFEPFFTTKEVGQGTGLGLATVYGIARQNGGFATVYSEVGQGSTFRVYLPKCTDAETPASAGPRATVAAPRGTETILLVEDEEQLLRLGKRMLSRLGYNVLDASSPRAALALAAGNGPIALLLTDVIMPQMTGREVWESLRQTRPGLKCLFMSGYTAEVIASRGVLEGGIHFIQKPFTQESLALKVREALDG